jgi:hypothetical protein
MELSPRQQAQAANLRTHLTEAEISDLLELARKTDPRAWAIFGLVFQPRAAGYGSPELAAGR